MEERLRLLEERLARAEGEVRLQRRIARGLGAAALALVIGTATFVTTRPAASQLEVQSLGRGVRFKAPFTVTDRQGRPLMKVVDTNAARGVLVFDPSGNLVSGIGQAGGDRGVAVFGATGKKVVGIGTAAQGQGMTIFDENEVTATWLGIGNPGPNQGRGILVKDATGATTARLGVIDQPDEGQIVLQDRQGSVLFQEP